MNDYKIELSVSEKYSSDNNIIYVNKQSNANLHEEVYKLAKYFKEELNYDTVPFSQLGILPKTYNVSLFTEQAFDKYIKEPMPYRIYGACLFTKMNFTNGKDYWVLEWIWIHPFFRNRGNLKKNWNILEEQFENFLIQEPVSPDMSNFLKKIDSKYAHTKIP